VVQLELEKKASLPFNEFTTPAFGYPSLKKGGVLSPRAILYFEAMGGEPRKASCLATAGSFTGLPSFAD